MNIVLIGFACSYKTSVGKLLADKLNYNYVDTDLMIEQTSNRSIADIFATQGEQSFRSMESALLDVVSTMQDTVVSCGGGSVLSRRFEQLTQNATVVWLMSCAETVYSRLGDSKRPLFDGKTVEELDTMIQQRTPLYHKYANITVSTDNKTSQQVADQIQNILQNK